MKRALEDAAHFSVSGCSRDRSKQAGSGFRFNISQQISTQAREKRADNRGWSSSSEISSQWRFEVNRKLLSGMFVAVLGIASCLFAQDATTPNAGPANVGGTWQLSSQGKRGDRDGTLAIRQDGSKLDGTFDMKGRSGPLSGSVEGNHISFTTEGTKGTVSFQGTVDGNKMSGTTKQGSSWSATRQ